MRLSNAAVAVATAAIFAPSSTWASCFALQHAPPFLTRTAPSSDRRSIAVKRLSPPRKDRMNLAGGKDCSREAFAASSSLLSRAREVLIEPAFQKMVPVMACAGAILGPNLDNYHSAFGVLTYKDPVKISIAGHILVTTDWW